MKITIDDLQIEYRISGQGEQVLLMHGWGVDSSTLDGLHEHLCSFMQVASLDLPGFGQSDAPQEAWSIYDYAAFIEKFCTAINWPKPHLIGHSFGGRLAIILGAKGFGRKIVLTGAAGIKPKRSLKYYFKVYSYKAAKRFWQLPLLNRHYDKMMAKWQKKNSKSDYALAKGIMRPILVKVVNEDLKYLLPQIKNSTLLIWGANDTAAPLGDGQIMEKLIKDSGLVVFENCGHYPFLEQPQRFYKICDSFFNKE